MQTKFTSEAWWQVLSSKRLSPASSLQAFPLHWWWSVFRNWISVLWSLWFRNYWFVSDTQGLWILSTQPVQFLFHDRYSCKLTFIPTWSKWYVRIQVSFSVKFVISINEIFFLRSLRRLRSDCHCAVRHLYRVRLAWSRLLLRHKLP